jgi:cytochrome c oxidase subunit I
MAHAATSTKNYLTDGYGLKSWLLTKDHKRIGLLYLFSVTAFFVLGALYAAGIRLELLTPAGDLVESDTYNKMFTMHGVIMVFFFLIPAIPATLGNFLVPLMIGAKDLAFPRLNLMSWYVYTTGGLFTLWALVTGGVDTGWTFYTPYSSAFANSNVALVVVGIFINGFSGILTGLNFIVTIHKMRAPGMTWFRLPLFIWAHYATSLIFILGTPVVAITLVMVGAERLLGLGIFDPKMGGDPVLFQHLFWFYSHPAVYIMILRVRPSSATRSSPSRASESRWSASSCGGTTCSSAASPSTRRWRSRSSATSSPSPRPSRSSIGRPRSTRGPSRSKRP